MGIYRILACQTNQSQPSRGIIACRTATRGSIPTTPSSCSSNFSRESSSCPGPFLWLDSRKGSSDWRNSHGPSASPRWYPVYSARMAPRRRWLSAAIAYAAELARVHGKQRVPTLRPKPGDICPVDIPANRRSTTPRHYHTPARSSCTIHMIASSRWSRKRFASIALAALISGRCAQAKC